VQQWRRSGQPVRDYCLAHGLKESAFYFWRRQLARRGAAGPQRQDGGGQPPAAKTRRGGRASAPRRASHARPDEARFLPVHVLMGREQAAAGGVEIVLGDGRTVRVPPGFDRQTLAEVLAVLEVRPC
jgi:transposase-like protein